MNDSGPEDRAIPRGVALYAIVGFILLLGAGGVFGLLTGRGRHLPAPPVPFNHEVHVVENELECSFCHTHVLDASYAGLPDLELCSMCHGGEPLGESPNEMQLIRLIEKDVPLEWVHRFRQPPHVFYSHRRHVVAGQLDCPTCHGNIGQSTTMPADVARLTMETCIGCHRRSGVATNCTTCHR